MYILAKIEMGSADWNSSSWSISLLGGYWAATEANKSTEYSALYFMMKYYLSTMNNS